MPCLQVCCSAQRNCGIEREKSVPGERQWGPLWTDREAQGSGISSLKNSKVIWDIAKLIIHLLTCRCHPRHVCHKNK